MWVAPLAGAWIEIPQEKNAFWKSFVAPLAGAWIEIIGSTEKNHWITSLPSRERGLK